VELEFVQGATKSVDLSNEKLSAIVASTGHEVGSARQIGKLDPPVYQIVLRGIDSAVLNAMQELDPKATMPNVEFVGPTVGKQLRDDGILAVVYALLCMLIYIALRFDFSYAPGAVLTLFHNSLVTVGLLSLIGEEFSLTTIAGLLTLVGYSINDTIVVFDRIRETVGKVKGSSLKDVLNRAINETLSRTVLTAMCVIAACICLIVIGRDTVLASYGLIMLTGIVIGTYSSIYVATPVFMWIRLRFGKPEYAEQPGRRGKIAEA
jgi:preprotein translocase subunit SecF